MPENRPAEVRRPNGTFAPGHTGNKGGRSRVVRELLDKARESVPEALAFARKLMLDEQQDARVRLDAAKLLISYGLGAPPKTTETEDDDSPILDALTLEEAKALAGLQAPPPPKEQH